MKKTLSFLLIHSFCASLMLYGSVFAAEKEPAEIITVRPTESQEAFRNPMKGFRVSTGPNSFRHEYATISQCYLKWSELENDEADTIEKIRAFCDAKWKSAADHGIKVIPRVYLDWDRKEGNEYWPADLQTGDYSSEAFQKRLVRLIERLGECWDQDPRVAWVQMGLIGFWGEQHSPSPTPEMQKLLGDAFARAFPHKKVVVRHADEFQDYEFGIYWDSWAHIQQINAPKHGAGIAELNRTQKRWLTAPIEGETAFNWGKYQIQPGDSPNDALSDPIHREFLIDSIRRLHCTGLGWIANYDPSIPAVQEGAAEVQKAFGYRFVLKSFSIPARVEPGQSFPLKFSVVNVGSAPFYENWPVEFSLLDPVTCQPVWQTTLRGVNLRKWLPGDDWDDEKNEYRIAPVTHEESVSVQLPDSIPAGTYAAALAIPDPFPGQPSIRFAIQDPFRDGRHPLCLIGVGLNSKAETPQNHASDH